MYDVLEKQIKFNMGVVLCVIGGFFISACDFHHPTFITPNKIRVEESTMREDINVHAFNTSQAAALARTYNGGGGGDMRLTVTYDPASRTNTAAHARNHLVESIALIRQNGVAQILGNIMPVHQSGNDSRLLITYDAYAAKPPAGCDTMPGLDDNNLTNDFDYNLGCSRDTLLARQIARPKDLIGQPTATATTDGRRAANILEPYRAGVPNAQLEGESSTGGN